MELLNAIKQKLLHPRDPQASAPIASAISQNAAWRIVAIEDHAQ
jgi:hypothetical protein